MAELRLSMTIEARKVLSDLLRLIAPTSARVSVNRAQIPDSDTDLSSYWTETLSAQATEEARLLAKAFAQAKGDPAIIILNSTEEALAFLRALSAVRLALRDLVFPEITDAQLRTLRTLMMSACRAKNAMPSLVTRALGFYSSR